MVILAKKLLTSFVDNHLHAQGGGDVRHVSMSYVDILPYPCRIPGMSSAGTEHGRPGGKVRRAVDLNLIMLSRE
jgi:hypothetical protein